MTWSEKPLLHGRSERENLASRAEKCYNSSMLVQEQFPGFKTVSTKRKPRMSELYGVLRDLGTITATEVQRSTRAGLFRTLNRFDIPTGELEAVLHKETPPGAKTVLPKGMKEVVLRAIRQFNADAIAERLDYELFLSVEEGVSMRKRQV